MESGIWCVINVGVSYDSQSRYCCQRCHRCLEGSLGKLGLLIQIHTGHHWTSLHIPFVRTPKNSLARAWWCGLREAQKGHVAQPAATRRQTVMTRSFANPLKIPLNILIKAYHGEKYLRSELTFLFDVLLSTFFIFFSTVRVHWWQLLDIIRGTTTTVLPTYDKHVYLESAWTGIGQ